MFRYTTAREGYKWSYLELYEEWKKEHEPSKRKGYLDGRFFHWVGIKYRDEKLYEVEFWEMIDILIRKNMTSHKFINASDDEKDEFYSNAIHKVNKYLFNSFDEKKQSLFVYATSTVTSAFYDVKREDKRQEKIKKAAADQLRGKVDNIMEVSKEQNYIFQDEELQEDMIKNDTKKLEQILNKINKTNFVLKRDVSLLENLDVPKFKRRYNTLQAILEPEDDIAVDKGLVVEYYDVSKFNEYNGIHQNYFKNQALTARRNGYQYFLVFSDVYDEYPEIIIERINNMLLEVTFGIDRYKDLEPKYLEHDYINQEDLIEENLMPPIWYGLKDDFKRRVAVLDGSLQGYMAFKEENEKATRIYSAGRVKVNKEG